VEWNQRLLHRLCGSGISTTATTVFTSISDFLGNTWTTISGAASSAWGGITTTLSGAWNGIKSTASTAFENVKTTISTAWDTVKTKTGTAWDAIQSSVESHGGGIKGIIGTAVDAYKSIWEAGFSKINDLTGGKLGDALSAARGKLGDIKGAFSSMIENAKGIVSGGLDRIKGFFAGCHLQLPHIKLPHFSISGSLSLNPPSVPHLSVDWYKKAMDDAYILNSPTIFGAAGGRLLGGGEAGQEAVVGTDKLAEIVQGALVGAGGGDIVIPVYIGNERIEELVVKAQQRVNYRSGGR
jgi:uncharacterized protein YjbJ (UPF0337 family)